MHVSARVASSPRLIPMTDPRPNPLFLADAPGLDFLNTIAALPGGQVDWLKGGDDLLFWLEKAGLAPSERIAAMRRSLSSSELDSVAEKARGLREWFRGFVRERAGRPLRSEALAKLGPLNELLERDESFGKIVAATPLSAAAHLVTEGGAFEWRWCRRWRSPDMLLLPIAQAMADLICLADLTHVKACEGAGCTLLFLDKTKRHGRRWCSMALCGNRAKQAAHRARTKAIAEG
jgi:predicted RNA-binding Zn ribbon-like protein